jgi:hypothetical protein
MIVQFETRKGKSVPFNESKVDVSHMGEEEQREVLSLLRTGRDLNGRLRLVDGCKLMKDGRAVLERYVPSVDITGQLV